MNKSDYEALLQSAATQTHADRHVFSTVVVKSLDDDKRIIEGIASTPNVDRQDDIVEPDGAQFKLPIPLLWQHNSANPVGWVTDAKVSKNGIRIKAQFAKVDEPASLKDELDRAWGMVKAQLVRGLSIGFNGLETTRIEGTFGRRFVKWEWLELSAVTIPANQDASIQTIKTISSSQISSANSNTTTTAPAHGQQRTASATQQRTTSAPGATGNPLSTFTKGNEMKPIKEQMEAFENKRAANEARLQELSAKAADEQRVFDDAEGEEYDTLSKENDQIDSHLTRLRAQQKRQLAQAQALDTGAGNQAQSGLQLPRSGIVSVKANLEPGQKMARYAMALAQGGGDVSKALAVYTNRKGWMDTAPEVADVLKSAVAAGDTTTSGWASELVYAQNIANEFIAYLRPQTILGKLTGFRRVPFNIRVPSQTAGGTGYWVGQGAPIPVSKMTTSSKTLGITKAAGLMAIDEELARSSSPSAELLVRDDLAATIRALLDVALIDPNQGGTANVQPASLTYGVTPTTPTGTTFAFLAADVKTTFATAIAANLNINDFVWVMTATTALALSLMLTSLGTPQFPSININGGTFMGLPVVVSQAANISGSPDYANMMVLINPKEVFLADDDQVTISVSNEASIQLLDNPTNTSTGGTTPTTVVSMFQTQSLAIKAVRYVNWTKARAEAVALIRTAAYA